jgi:hypothetical protein
LGALIILTQRHGKESEVVDSTALTNRVSFENDWGADLNFNTEAQRRHRGTAHIFNAEGTEAQRRVRRRVSLENDWGGSAYFNAEAAERAQRKNSNNRDYRERMVRPPVRRVVPSVLRWSFQ